jgi:hypothetical protein
MKNNLCFVRLNVENIALCFERNEYSPPSAIYDDFGHHV